MRPAPLGPVFRAQDAGRHEKQSGQEDLNEPEDFSISHKAISLVVEWLLAARFYGGRCGQVRRQFRWLERFHL